MAVTTLGGLPVDSECSCMFEAIRAAMRARQTAQGYHRRTKGRRTGELGVRCRSRSATSDVVRDIVDLYRPMGARRRGKGELVRTFSQFLSATIGPSVALVSAPSTIPPSKRQPTMVVPVEVALGRCSLPELARP